MNKIIYVVYPKKANPKKLWKFDGDVESFITESLAKKFAKKIGGFVSEQTADNEIYRSVKSAEKSYKASIILRTYNYVLDFDTIEELYSGEIEDKNLKDAREKILEMISISILPEKK